MWWFNYLKNVFWWSCRVVNMRYRYERNDWSSDQSKRAWVSGKMFPFTKFNVCVVPSWAYCMWWPVADDAAFLTAHIVFSWTAPLYVLSLTLPNQRSTTPAQWYSTQYWRGLTPLSSLHRTDTGRNQFTADQCRKSLCLQRQQVWNNSGRYFRTCHVCVCVHGP